MKGFFDTSVLVPVFYGDHVHHQASLALFIQFDKSTGCCGAHSLAEVYSTLTRMPGKHRISGEQAMLFIGSIRERLSIIALSGDEYADALQASAALGIVGGGIYDAMLAHCAIKAKAEAIYSWNIRHYAQCGPEVTRRMRWGNMDRPRLFLIDAFGFIFRAYHARARSGAPPMRTRAGMATEAVYIFHNMLRRLLAAHKPDQLAAVFEGEGPTFREQVFEAYKANRTETPPELIEQIPLVRRLLEAMRIPVLSYAGFEADDVIGAMARQAEEAGLEVVVVSSDKDMLQLVGEGISMLNPMKDDEWYDAAKVKEFLGVEPSQVADLLALKGDASDNIPGAPGIGDKGARELIARFGSVEAALEGAASVERKMYRESLQNNRERILMSKRLATLDTSVPVAWSPEQFQVVPPDREALRGVYQELEFFSFLKDLEAGEQSQLDCMILETPEELDACLGAMPADATVAVAVTGNTDGGLLQGMVGLAWKPGEGRGVGLEWIEKLRPLLEDPARPKVAHDVKSVMQALAKAGVEAQGFGGDVMLYAFLLEADPAGCSLEHLAQRRLNRKLGSACEERAASVLELAAVLSREVEERGFGELYRTMDLPLLAVLTRMERAGIRVDPVALAGFVLAHGDGHREAHRRDPRAGGAAVQHQLSATTGQGPV